MPFWNLGEEGSRCHAVSRPLQQCQLNTLKGNDNIHDEGNGRRGERERGGEGGGKEGGICLIRNVVATQVTYILLHGS